MNDDFHTLMDFLGRLGPEVTGHATAFPNSSGREKLKRLMGGLDPGTERQEVCELLRLHPAWIRWLADRVKMARSTSHENAR